MERTEKPSGNHIWVSFDSIIYFEFKVFLGLFFLVYFRATIPTMLDLPVVVFIIGMIMCHQKYNDNISIQFLFF